MPIIPPQQQQISMDVPGADMQAGNQGIIGQAISNFGLQTIDFTNDILKVEAKSKAFEQLMQTQIDSERQYQIIVDSSQDGFIYDENGKNKGTIDQVYREWANKRYEQDQKLMPSGLAQEVYRDQAMPYFTNQIRSAIGEARKMRITATERGIDTTIDRAADKVYRLPILTNQDGGGAFDLVDKIDLHLMDLHNTKIEATGEPAYAGQLVGGKKKLSRTTISKQFVEGYMNWVNSTPDILEKTGATATQHMLWLRDVVQGTSRPDNGIEGARDESGAPTTLTELRRKNGKEGVTDMLDPTSRDSLLDQINGFLKGNTQRMDSSSIETTVGWLSKAAENRYTYMGDRAYGVARGKAEGMVVAGLRSKAITPHKAADLMKKLQVSERFGKYDRSMAAKSKPLYQQQQELLSQAKAVGAEAEVIAKAVNQFADPASGIEPVEPEAYKGAAIAEYTKEVYSKIQVDNQRFEEDPVKEVTVNNLGTAKYLESLPVNSPEGFSAEQVKLFGHLNDFIKGKGGVTGRKTHGVFSNAQLKVHADYLKSIRANPEELSASLVNKYMTGGGYYVETLRAGVERGIIDPGYLVALQLAPSKYLTADVIQAITAGDAIEKDYAQWGENPGKKTWGEHITEVDKKFSVHLERISRGMAKDSRMSLQMKNLYRQTIAYKAYQTMKNTGAGRDEAIRGAGEDFFRNFTTLDVGTELSVPKYAKARIGVAPGGSLVSTVQLQHVKLDGAIKKTVEDTIKEARKNPEKVVKGFKIVAPPSRGGKSDLSGETLLRYLRSGSANLRPEIIIEDGQEGIGWFVDLIENDNRIGSFPLEYEQHGRRRRAFSSFEHLAVGGLK